MTSRSSSSGRFAIIPSQAVEDQRLSPAALRVLCCLGTYGDKEGWCWPSMRTMAARLGITRSTVIQHTHVLAQLGYLEIHQQKRADGGAASNHYRLLFDRALFVVREEVEGGVGPADRGGRPSRPGRSADAEGLLILNDPIERTLEVRADDNFDTFWRTYPPRRPHSNPKKTARQKFDIAVKRGVSPATIVRGAKNYAAYIERERVEPRFVKQGATWLHQECWAEYQEAPPAAGGDAGRL